MPCDQRARNLATSFLRHQSCSKGHHSNYQRRTRGLDVLVLYPPSLQGAPSELEMLENILFWENFKDDEDVVGVVPNVAQVSPTTKHSSSPNRSATCQSPPQSPSGEVKDKRVDGPPDDVGAFFGHPLTRATIAINGEDQEAQAQALFHEYLNLQAIDRDGVKIADRLATILDTIRSDKREDDDNDYISIYLQNETIDELLGGAGETVTDQQDGGVSPTLRIKIIDDVKGQEDAHGHQKSAPCSEVRKGAVRRQSHDDSPATSALAVQMRRSESEPNRTLTEKLSRELHASFPAHQLQLYPSSSAAAVVAAASNKTLTSIASLQTHTQADSEAPSATAGENSPASPGIKCGLEASLTVTASLVSSLDSSALLRGHSILSSSSPAQIPASRQQFKRVRVTRSARSDVCKSRPPLNICKREHNRQKSDVNTSSNAQINQRKTTVDCNSSVNSFASAPTSTPNSPSVAVSPTVPATATVTLSPHTPCTLPAVSVHVDPPVCCASVGLVVTAPVAVNPTCSSPSSCPLPPSPDTGAAGIAPLQALAVQSSEAVVQSTAVSPHVTVPLDLAGDSVKQTTKEKLKQRIAQTTMTQPLQQVSEVQHQHQHQHVAKQPFQSGLQLHLDQSQQNPYNPHQKQYTTLPQQSHQLHQEKHHQHHIHAQQRQQEEPPAPEALVAAAEYFNEEEFAAMNGGGKYGQVLSSIKREGQYLEYDPQYPPPYNSGGSMQILYNSVPMVSADGLTSGAHNDLVAMGSCTGESHPGVISETDQIISQFSAEPALVQSQYLHLLQPLDMVPQQLNNGYYNPNCDIYMCNNTAANNNDLTKIDENLLDMDANKDHVVRYVQQQQQHQQQLHHDQYGYQNTYHHYMSAGGQLDTSPDSGISNDPCLSPKSLALGLKESSLTDGTITREGKSLKRRKASGNSILQRQHSSGSDRVSSRSTTVQKLEVNTTGYQYFLESPISTTQRLDEDRVTYLNKSQYYPLTLENITPDRLPKGVLCKSVIMLVFREEKSKEEEAKAWQFWHSRQHSYKQRILDIDTKNSQGVGQNSINELAFNAVSVKWNPRDGPVRVNIAVHCLSTDFSNQKGVKGIPLHIQIDTHEIFETRKELHPVHRGFCQIKVFCDKGAERKTRDEERRRNAKTNKTEAAVSPGRKRSEDAFHSPCDRSEFYSMANLSTLPVFFSPSYQTGEFQQCASPIEENRQEEESSNHVSPSQVCDQSEDSGPTKMPRLNSCASCNKHLTPLLYVKENCDKAYHAIHLDVPTVDELLKAIGYKFNKSMNNVANFYKRSKKGILVRMDENIIRHYSHESAFLLEINKVGPDDLIDVILAETCQ